MRNGGPNRVGVSGVWWWGSSGRSGSVAPSKSCNPKNHLRPFLFLIYFNVFGNWGSLGAFCFLILKRDLGNMLSIFPRQKQQNAEFTKFSSVQTPEIYQLLFFRIGPDPVSSDLTDPPKILLKTSIDIPSRVLFCLARLFVKNIASADAYGIGFQIQNVIYLFSKTPTGHP